ncbi:MAG: 16S rRNA (uracil(1498)-N(3))-methyltransferase [Phycisphaerales bacterium]|nr:16S rRNA (uracil(1498)-N(3))-methyltransferase [Phycisphaerales bacterium]
MVTIHRFYCPVLRVGIVELDVDESRHALTSLRLRPGDRAELFDGIGGLAIGEFTGDPGERGKHRGGPTARLAVSEVQRAAAPPQRFEVLTAAPKGSRLDWLIEKCTELGAAAVSFLDFERSVARPSESAAAKHRRATIEASKQCGRLWLPELSAGLSLRETVDRFDGLVALCDPSPEAQPFAEWLAEHRKNPRLGVLVGPEGGISPGELAWLAEREVPRVRISSTILRVETAAVAAVAAWSCGNCDAAAG